MYQTNIYFSGTPPRDLKGQTYRIDMEFRAGFKNVH